MSSSHLRLLYNSCRVAPGKRQLEAKFVLHHPGNRRTSAPSGHLQTTSEHSHPAPAQLILHRGWRLVVSGHSQSLQLTGLGKSLPLICQQQPRLNYKRRVYSAHTKGSSQVTGEAVPWTLQGTCFIRPHYKDMESKQLFLMHKNKHRKAAKNKETNKHGPNKGTDQNSRKRAK
ncbi:hypothetical protein HJG60_010527 [Phyllostomus discolor]|uniref:Uncharacterized protein n=1 Tax=Phyllostomus discolor TaxID=89673 RepID=A0A834ANY1_9CHIR|nr:hypothetical protein HJG60_010527 [Phyllostomus discolor]